MSVFRVIIKDVKKCTSACDACRRRKGKCDGGSPCNWCASHKMECLVSNSRRRGPKRCYEEISQELDIVDKREMGVLTEMELSHYIDLYLTNSGSTMLCMPWDLKSDESDLKNPKTFSQLGIKYALSAVTARACGHRERASQLIQTAKYFIAQAFDTFTVDILRCYMILASYWISTDFRLFKFYMMMARNTFTCLPSNAMPERTRALVDLVTAFFGNNIPFDRGNIAVLCENTTVVQQRVWLNATCINLGVAILGPIHDMKVGNSRPDILAILTSQVMYSEDQRTRLLSDVDICKKLLAEMPELEGCVILKLQIKAIECFVEWRSNNIRAALPIAIEIANTCTSNMMLFGNRHDIEFMLPICIFLCEQKLYDLADKLCGIANSLYNCVRADVPFAENESTISQYIAAQLGPSPPPSPPVSLSPIDATTPSSVLPRPSPDQLPTYVISLARLLYTKSPNNLFSSADLQLLYNTINNLLPPYRLPLDFRRPVRLAIDEPSPDILQVTLSLSPHVTPPGALLPSPAFTHSIPLISDNITAHGNIIINTEKMLSTSGNYCNNSDNINNYIGDIINTYTNNTKYGNNININNFSSYSNNTKHYNNIINSANNESVEEKIPILHYFTASDGVPHEISTITNQFHAPDSSALSNSLLNLLANPNSIGDDFFQIS